MNKASSIEQYSEEEIIDKIILGETKLYEILIRRYNGPLYKIGRTYHFSHDDTEDLMQEAYISAFYSLSKFEKKASFKTWISRIMLHKCYHKKQTNEVKLATKMETDQTEKLTPMFQQTQNTEKSFLNKELGHVLEVALNKIPTDYSIVFTLRELNGLSVAETQESLNISESNVKTRLNRAKKMLKSEIEKIYAPEEIFEFNLKYCDGIVNRVMNEINKKISF